MEIDNLTEEELQLLKKDINKKLHNLSLNGIPRTDLIDLCSTAKELGRGVEVKQEVHSGVYAVKTLYIKYFEAESVDDELVNFNKFITVPEEMDKEKLKLSKENKKELLNFREKCKDLMNKTKNIADKYNVSFGDVTLKVYNLLGKVE